MGTSQVIVMEYDPSWQTEYESEKARILAALAGESIWVEHIGSTSVPGLAAKPIVDIAVGVAHLSIADAFIQPLAAIGYEYVPKPEFPPRRFFRQGEWGKGTHHLHVYEIGSEEWKGNLLFRDSLRSDPGLRRQYAELKADLASRHPDDRAAYTAHKGPFIRTVMERAGKQAQGRVTNP
ncbi:GrpB family protein [Paenibacillus sp. D9]|uniref:GrpB family protein n=1 Tax=Paenibacillus sp. D9 TaxID=665792 RepID=UPI000AC08B6F|nr:GrpB family protein [Paenibacillus sp. D9]